MSSQIPGGATHDMEPLQGDEQVLHNLQMQVDMVQQVKRYLFFASH